MEILSFQKKTKTNYWINIISFKMLNLDQTRKLSLKLLKKKIETRRIWRPLNLQSYLKKYETYNIIDAHEFYSNSLCVPSNDNLSISDIDKISNYIKRYKYPDLQKKEHFDIIKKGLKMKHRFFKDFIINGNCNSNQ